MKTNIWIRIAWVAPLFLLLTAFTMGRFSNVLPKIMGDELIYSLNALERPLAESTHPNYIYSWLFSSVGACGDNFYLCNKWLNMVFLLGLVAMVYLIARLFAKPGIALTVAVLTMLGPISNYVTYFTPDLMFYFTVIAIVYWLLRFDESSSWLLWTLAGAALGLSALVKPHALFLLPTLLLYALWLSWRADRARWLLGLAKGAVAVASTMVVKLAIGFAIAGERGLGLFGGNYDGALNLVVSGRPERGSGANVKPAFSLLDPAWIGTFGVQLVMHLAVWLVFMGVPLMVLLTESRRLFTVKSAVDASALAAGVGAAPTAVLPSKAQGSGKSKNKRSGKGTSKPQPPSAAVENEFALRFVAVTLIMLISLIGVASLYASISGAWGETLVNRVMIRYYEFMVVLLPIAVLIPSLTKWRSKLSSWLIPLVSLVVMVVGTLVLLTMVPPIYTDSALLASTRDSGILYWVLIPISVGFIGYWLHRREEATKFWFYGFWPLIVVLYLITSYNNMVAPGSVQGLYTTSTFWVRENLTEEQREDMIVFGNDKRLVQTSQFWLRDPSIRGIQVNPKRELNLNDMPRDTYLLFIGDMTANGQAQLIFKTEEFMVLKTPVEEVVDQPADE